MRRTAALCSVVLFAGALAACSGADPDSIVVATPSAITIKSVRFESPPLEAAQAHCGKYGKKAVSRGGVKLGSPSLYTMWGFDCVDKGQ